MRTEFKLFAALALWAVVVSLFLPGSQPSRAYGAPIQVSVFSFPGLTEGNGSCGDEVDNLEEIISQLGYTVDRTITSLADGGTTFLAKLNASQFFFVPDMESAFTVASSDFPDTAVTAFRTWLNGGGVFVMTGTSGTKDVDFINRMTGWSLASASGSSATRVDANVTGTAFDGAANAVTLGTPSATDSINGSAAPAEANFKPLWGTATQAAVATMNYGSGTIVYLGWDFYNAGFSGVNDYTSAACPSNSDDWVQKIVPATLTYASNLSGASPLENISTSGGDFPYEFSQSGTSYFLVVASGDTAPSAAEVKAGVDYTGGTVLDSGSASTTADTEHIFTISGLTEARGYVVYSVTEHGASVFSTVGESSFSTQPGVPSVSSVTAGNGQVSVAISPSSTETNFEYSTDGGTTWTGRSSASVSSPWVITGLTNGITYSLQFRSSYGGQKGASTSASSATPVAPPSSAASPSPVVIPPVATPPPKIPVKIPVLQPSPVLFNDVIPAAPKAPTAYLDGRLVEVTKNVPNSSQLDISVGNLSIGVGVEEQQGRVTEAADGSTQIEVRNGASALLSGTGMLPGWSVQVFLPGDGSNARELTRIPVNAEGSFDGSASFATRSNEVPLPVGKNVLQLVSLDEDGNQLVLEITVNIAQGVPAPEKNRITGVIPTMTPGQSTATSGGKPVPVTITPVSDQKLAVVEGDGWTMTVNVNSEQGGVETAVGGALLKFVRNESAVISGSGFMSGTRAYVYFFSDPTLLGTVTVDENGEFTGEVNIDPNMISVGQHTLQLQGVGEDGYVKAANMGVLVDDATVAATATGEQSLNLIWWVFAAAVLVALVFFLLVARRRNNT